MKPIYEKVPIRGGKPYHFWARKVPVFPFEWHYHPEYELTLITRGQGTRVVGDDVSEYQAGDLVLIGPNLPHTWASRAVNPSRRKDANSALVFQFTPAIFGEGILGHPELAPLAGLMKRSARGLRFHGQVARQAGQKLAEALGARGLRQLAGLYEVLDLLASRGDGRILSSRTMNEEGTPRRNVADRLYHYINQHCLEQIDLSAAAASFNMTPSTFHRQLKRATGRTFTQLVNELRISHACSLLTQGDRTIADICYQCGFQNLSYFNRKFLRLKNMTPRQYRAHFAGDIRGGA